MEWLNLRTSVLHAPQYIGCDPRARSTWLSVSLWCAQQENGGRIEGSREWKDRQWQQTCGVTRREVDSASPLLSWEGSVLIVWNYPFEKESVVRIRRESGRLGGINSGASRATKSEAIAEPKPEASNEANASFLLEANASTERKGIGIGKERNKKGASAPAPVGAVFPLCLETPAFQSAWADWLAYRRERRLAVWKPLTVAAKLRELAEAGEPAAVESIRQSIANGWQGLFPPRTGANGSIQRAAPRTYNDPAIKIT